MNFKVLAGLFSLLISSIAAIKVIDFPMDFLVAPGDEMKVKLEDSDLVAGDYVRIELWDNQNDEDVNVAIIGEEIKVQDGNMINMRIPADFHKTHNAFLRIFHKCHNAVTPRFTIKAPKNCINTKVPHKPTEHPTPIVIHKPEIHPTPAPTPIVIHAGVSHVDPIAPTAGNPDHVVAPVIVSTPVRHSSIKSSVTIKSSSSSSTSSASVAKFSASSIAVAMAVAFAMLF